MAIRSRRARDPGEPPDEGDRGLQPEQSDRRGDGGGATSGGARCGTGRGSMAPVRRGLHRRGAGRSEDGEPLGRIRTDTRDERPEQGLRPPRVADWRGHRAADAYFRARLGQASPYRSEGLALLARVLRALAAVIGATRRPEEDPATSCRIVLVGFGNVGREFARLLLKRRSELAKVHGP